VRSCAEGGATFRASLPGPTPIGPSAGSLLARLLAVDGTELSARRWQLVWADGAVSAEVPLVLASPGGAIRFRWCHPLPAGASEVWPAEPGQASAGVPWQSYGVVDGRELLARGAYCPIP
jgi:hypothetical protein